MQINCLDACKMRRDLYTNLGSFWLKLLFESKWSKFHKYVENLIYGIRAKFHQTEMKSTNLI